MKKSVAVFSLFTSAALGLADVISFDISPPGISAAVGLSPSNELHTVLNSTGSGNEVLAGVSLETTNMVLDLAFGYGSIAGFDDLTGPVTAVQIHGPAPASGTAGVLVNLASLHVPAGDPAKGGIVFGSVILDAETSSNLLAGFTYLNLITTQNPDGELRGQLVAMLNSPPSVTALEPLTLECASRDGTVGTLTVTVNDPDDDALSVVWTVDGMDFQTNSIAGGESAAGVVVQFHAAFGLGTHQVAVTVTDDDGESATSMTTVTVVDTTPPVIESITATPNILWPPNHRLVPVRINVRATDTCGGLRARVISITSSESPNGLGDGNTRPDYFYRRPVRIRSGDSSDWRILSPLRVMLRAERSGQGSDRVYTVEVEVRDGSDNTSTGVVEVRVPHDRGAGSAKPSIVEAKNKVKKPKKSKDK